MLKFHWKRTVAAEAAETTAADRDDLRIRNLLDDPRLAHAMTLDLGEAFAQAAPVHELVPPPRRSRPNRPAPIFNRRRLLESDAA